MALLAAVSGDQPGPAVDQLVVLPGGQLTGLDVHLGPAHDHAALLGELHPGPDVGVVVQPAHHDLVAGAASVLAMARAIAYVTVVMLGAQDDAARDTAHEVGHRRAGAGDQPLGAGGGGEDPAPLGDRHPQRVPDRPGDVLGQQRATGPVDVHVAVGQRREEAADPSDVEPGLHAAHPSWPGPRTGAAAPAPADPASGPSGGGAGWRHDCTRHRQRTSAAGRRRGARRPARGHPPDGPAGAEDGDGGASRSARWSSSRPRSCGSAR